MSERGWYFFSWVLVWLAFLLAIFCTNISPAFSEPVQARQYRNELIREARSVWGMNAPIAAMAGQIEQESGWKPNACSAVACGLSQFTNSTATWLSGVHRDLGPADVFNPAWALRALIIYDHDLHNQVPKSATDCHCWAFTLSSYNGGIGNLKKDVLLCLGPVCRRNQWWKHVAERSRRSPAAFIENRRYPDAILRRRQYTYATWGATVSCPS